MFKLRHVPLCVLGTAVCQPLLAVTTTPEVVVTATRTPMDTGAVAASTTVISRADIEARQVNSLPELLRGLPGLDVVETGGLGKTTTFFMRGAEADHVLVLVNGIRTGSVSAGVTSFEFIPIEHIERIEIVRGPRASQWGSEAIGGVIQIFTRSGEYLEPGDTSHEAGAGAGSYDTYRGHVATSGRSGDTHFQFSAGYIDTGGFDARQPVPGSFGFDQPDDDGFDNLSVHLRGGHRFSDSFEVDAFVLRADGATEFDGSFQDNTDFTQQVLGARADWQLNDSTALRFRAGENRDERESFAPDGSFASRFDSKRRELSALADMEPVAGHVLSAGVDYRDDRIDASTAFTETTRDNTGVFGQYIGEFGAHNLAASLRYDDNEAFGSETTGGLGWSMDLDSSMRVYVSWGTAFKTPSFNELFFPGFGNPGLEPETSESIEAGFEARPDWGFWSLRAYRTDIDDLIATVFDPVTGTSLPQNVDRARIDGFEAEIRTAVAGFDLGASLHIVDPEDRDTGNQLPRRPDTSLSVNVSRRFDKLRIGGRLIAQDDRFDDVNNTVEADAFATVDLVADYELRPGLSLRGRLGNLFDEDYETAATFNSPGRHVFVSVLYQDRP